MNNFDRQAQEHFRQAQVWKPIIIGLLIILVYSVFALFGPGSCPKPTTNLPGIEFIK